MPTTDRSIIATELFKKFDLDLEGDLLDFCTAALQRDNTQNVDAWAHAVSAVLAIKASEKQAQGLKLTSWVLAGATVVLAFATCVLAAATIALLFKS